MSYRNAMLSPQEKLSDLISDIFGSVGATGIVSSAEYSTLQLASNSVALAAHERKSVVRLLRAVKRGKVQVMAHAMAS